MTWMSDEQMISCAADFAVSLFSYVLFIFDSPHFLDPIRRPKMINLQLVFSLRSKQKTNSRSGKSYNHRSPSIFQTILLFQQSLVIFFCQTNLP